MAIAAINPKARHMMRVAEWHRLVNFHANACVERGKIKGVTNSRERDDREDSSHRDDTRQRVMPPGKKLGHDSLLVTALGVDASPSREGGCRHDACVVSSRSPKNLAV
jgi:hypothetical protein